MPVLGTKGLLFFLTWQISFKARRHHKRFQHKIQEQTKSSDNLDKRTSTLQAQITHIAKQTEKQVQI